MLLLSENVGKGQKIEVEKTEIFQEVIIREGDNCD